MHSGSAQCVEIPQENNPVNLFRIEKYGKIRLILHNPPKAVLIGQYRPGFLTLFKTKDNLGHMSFTTGIPRELWRFYQSELKLIAIQIRESGRCFYAYKDDVSLYGYEPDKNQQSYIYLDALHWKAIDSLGKCAELLKDKQIRTWQSDSNKAVKRAIGKGSM